MTTSATALDTYLWHYMLARVLYDELVQPLLHGHVRVTWLVVAGVIVAFALARGRRRRRI
jgi:hypothetical protein